MKIKYSIITGYTSWCGLGFIRGINYYKYTHDTLNKNNNNDKNKPYIYSNSIIDGFLGIFIYGNPIFLPIIIHKELYRLEVSIRNLENEKKTKYYNNLL